MSEVTKGRKYLLAMVGLPARGKSFSARKLTGYLNWLGYHSKVFNVGEKRRKRLGARHAHNFFSPNDPNAVNLRDEIALEVLEEALTFLDGLGHVAIHDATNSRPERRAVISKACQARGVELIFIEVVNNDPAVIERNIRETKLRTADYRGMDPDQALRDFFSRIANYKLIYRSVGEDEGSFVRLIDRGNKFEMHRIDGYLPARIVFFLLNLHISSCSVWLTRHGESLFNQRGKIGGDAPLTVCGEEFARRLARHVDQSFTANQSLEVWTSVLQRAVQTAAFLNRDTIEWHALNEIDAGQCEGMHYDAVRNEMPDEFAARSVDKLRYRYPRGESYEDVIQRVDRIIIEAERQPNAILIIAHQAVLRALYAYFRGVSAAETPYVSIPLHTVIKLTAFDHGCDEDRVFLGPELV